MSDSQPDKPAGDATQQVEAFKRRLHERIGEGITKHWTEIASGIGGVIAGAFAVYCLFASQVHDAAKAASDAKDVSVELKSTVGHLQDTVAQLATRDFVEAQVAPVRQWEADHQALPNNKEAEEALRLPPHRGRGPPPKR